MRESSPADATTTEPSPEDAVTRGWLDDAAVYLTLPAEEAEPERPDGA